jgi:hypothetical protein
VLAVLDEHPTQGVLDLDGLSLESFIDRALAIMPQHSASAKPKILELLDPRPNAATGPPNKHQEPRPQAQVRTRRPAATGGRAGSRPPERSRPGRRR